MEPHWLPLCYRIRYKLAFWCALLTVTRYVQSPLSVIETSARRQTVGNVAILSRTSLCHCHEPRTVWRQTAPPYQCGAGRELIIIVNYAKRQPHYKQKTHRQTERLHGRKYSITRLNTTAVYTYINKNCINEHTGCPRKKWQEITRSELTLTSSDLRISYELLYRLPSTATLTFWKFRLEKWAKIEQKYRVGVLADISSVSWLFFTTGWITEGNFFNDKNDAETSTRSQALPVYARMLSLWSTLSYQALLHVTPTMNRISSKTE